MTSFDNQAKEDSGANKTEKKPDVIEHNDTLGSLMKGMGAAQQALEAMGKMNQLKGLLNGEGAKNEENKEKDGEKQEEQGEAKTQTPKPQDWHGLVTKLWKYDAMKQFLIQFNKATGFILEKNEKCHDQLVETVMGIKDL